MFRPYAKEHALEIFRACSAIKKKLYWEHGKPKSDSIMMLYSVWHQLNNMHYWKRIYEGWFTVEKYNCIKTPKHGEYAAWHLFSWTNRLIIDKQRFFFQKYEFITLQSMTQIKHYAAWLNVSSLKSLSHPGRMEFKNWWSLLDEGGEKHLMMFVVQSLK